MYSEAIATCKICGEEIRVNSREWVNCPNECYRMRLSSYGMSFQYDICDNENAPTLSNISSTLEERDYIKFDKEMIDLIEKLKNFSKEESSNFDINSHFYYNIYDSNILDDVGIELFVFIEDTKYLSYNSIHLNLYFVNAFHYGTEKLNNEALERQKDKIKDFLSFVDKIKNKEIDLSNRKDLRKIDWYDVEEEPIGITNNKYYF